MGVSVCEGSALNAKYSLMNAEQRMRRGGEGKSFVLFSTHSEMILLLHTLPGFSRKSYKSKAFFHAVEDVPPRLLLSPNPMPMFREEPEKVRTFEGALDLFLRSVRGRLTLTNRSHTKSRTTKTTNLTVHGKNSCLKGVQTPPLEPTASSRRREAWIVTCLERSGKVMEMDTLRPGPNRSTLDLLLT